MGITKCVQEYHCDSGCEIDGCPGHTATLEFNSTANVYHLDMGDGKDLWLDNSSAQAVIDLFTFFSDTRADTARVRRKSEISCRTCIYDKLIHKNPLNVPCDICNNFSMHKS